MKKDQNTLNLFDELPEEPPRSEPTRNEIPRNEMPRKKMPSNETLNSETPRNETLRNEEPALAKTSVVDKPPSKPVRRRKASAEKLADGVARERIRNDLDDAH